MPHHMEVWVDGDLCTGCGKCQVTAPDVFTLVNGVTYVKEGNLILKSCDVAVVPYDQEILVKIAAMECPGEIIDLRYRDAELVLPGDLVESDQID